jgi:hypothetical protein
LAGQPVVLAGEVVAQDFVFQHGRLAEVVPAGIDLHHAGAAIAFAAAVGDAGADFFGNFDDAGAGRHGDGDVDVFECNSGFGHGFLLG